MNPKPPSSTPPPIPHSRPSFFSPRIAPSLTLCVTRFPTLQITKAVPIPHGLCTYFALSLPRTLILDTRTYQFLTNRYCVVIFLYYLTLHPIPFLSSLFFWTDRWASYIRAPAPLHMPKDAVIDRRLSVDFHSFITQVHTLLAGNDLYLLVS